MGRYTSWVYHLRIGRSLWYRQSRVHHLSPTLDRPFIYYLGHWLTLRTGYTYGSNPVGQENLYANLLVLAIVTNQVSVDATENLGDHWQLVEAYMHAFINHKSGRIPGTDIPISTTLAENAFGMQINYLF